MQDLDHSVKPHYLDFSKGNLTMPMILSRTIDAESARNLDIHPDYNLDTPLIDIVREQAQDQNKQQTKYSYLPDRNVLIYAGNKAGSTSVNAMLWKLKHVTGLEFIEDLNCYALLDLIETRDPEIWYVYRDPVSRFISYFYYIGEQDFFRHGVRWDWRGVDMFNGIDPHRLPQFMSLPVYINNPQIHERIRDIGKTVTNLPGHPQGRISQEWAYDMLKDFIPDKKVKFFWLHEDGTPNRTNPIEIMYHKLGIGNVLDNDKSRPYIKSQIRANSNPFRPKWDDIPRDFKQKIWDATIPEREFLSKIRWQNGPISFHGLS